MKTVYLVRHGQSVGNAGLHYQTDDSPLSGKGQAQALAIAERVARLPIDAVIASTMPRAQETVSIIAAHTGRTFESSQLFVERRRISAQQGLLRESDEARALETEYIKSSSTPGYRYADEENFDDLVARGNAALAYLAAHEKDQLLVVTHGIFLRVLVACAIFGEAVDGRIFDHVLGGFQTSNTGLSALTYDPKKPRPWSVLTWNDHAHLG